MFMKCSYFLTNWSKFYVVSFCVRYQKDATLVAGDDNSRELEGALRAVYALWWDPTKPTRNLVQVHDSLIYRRGQRGWRPHVQERGGG